jgi:hypothetical protein
LNFLLPFFLTALAHAYLPPAFFVYSRLAEQKTKTPVTAVAITVARPQASGTEEILGTTSISLPALTEGGWPGLSLLFHSDSQELFRAVAAFGLQITPEHDLLRVDRSRLSSLKEAPYPFYKTDFTMSLKRTRQTYAWVHSSADGARSIWVEKDSFLPLKVAAPCPAEAAALAWAKAGNNKCELEFRNLYALRHGNLQSARMTLWKDGSPLLFFTFDRLASGKTKLPLSDGTLTPDVASIVHSILH